MREQKGDGSASLCFRSMRALCAMALGCGVLAACGSTTLRTERIFQSLERASEPDAAFNFAVGARCYRLEQSGNETFPRLMQRNCQSQSVKLLVDFATIMPGALKLVRGVRISPDGTTVAISGIVDGTSKLFVVPISPREDSKRAPAAMYDAPFAFEWFKDSQRLLVVRNDFNGTAYLSQIRADSVLETAIPFHSQPGRYLHLARASAGTFLYVIERDAFSDRWSAIPADATIISPKLITNGTSRALACELGSHRLVVRDSASVPGYVEIIPNSGGQAQTIRLPEAVTLEALDCFSSGAALTAHDGWTQRVYWIDASTKQISPLRFSGQWHSVPTGQPYDTESIEFQIQGLVLPPRRAWLSVGIGALSEEAAPTLAPATVEHFEVRSLDGAAIPVVAISASDISPKPNSPILLHAYGAYGQAVSQGYSPLAVELLARGFRYVIANIRGGAGRGLSWHVAGSGTNVSRRMEDLVAVAMQLQQRYHTEKIFGFGRSAGAVPLLAAAAHHPALFTGIILDAPLVRPVSLEGIAPNWERQEWGPFNRSIDPISLLEVSPPPPSFVSFSKSDPIVPASDILAWADRATRLYGASSQISLLPVSASSHAGADYHEAEHRLAAQQIEFMLTQLHR